VATTSGLSLISENVEKWNKNVDRFSYLFNMWLFYFQCEVCGVVRNAADRCQHRRWIMAVAWQSQHTNGNRWSVMQL